jgi:hypothetical protein
MTMIGVETAKVAVVVAMITVVAKVAAVITVAAVAKVAVVITVAAVAKVGAATMAAINRTA